MVLLEPIWFLVRRLFLAVMVVFLSTTVIWQVALMTMTVVTQVIILGRVEPFALPSRVRYEFFSECVVMLVMYHMICFTPFVADLETRFRIGYSVCTVVSVHLAYSLGIMLKTALQDLRRMYRIRNASKEHDKQRTELQKRLVKRAPSIREKRLAKRKRLVEEREKRENELLEEHKKKVLEEQKEAQEKVKYLKAKADLEKARREFEASRHERDKMADFVLGPKEA